MSIVQGLHLYLSRQASGWRHYLLEQILFALVGWIPTILGIGIRGILYRLILRMDGLAAIENGVRLRMSSNIKLGHNVYLDQGVYLHACPSGIEIGSDTIVMHGAVLHVYNFRDLPHSGIKIGSNSLVGEYTVIRGQGGVEIGDRVYTSPFTQILAVNHVFLGVAGLMLAAAVAVGLVMTRLSGVTTVGAWGVAALFGGLVSGVTSISLIALGVTFNYLVTFFNKRPELQGLFGLRLFNPPLDHHFGWMGTLSLVTGLVLGGVSLALGVNGWDIARLWLYLLGSAMLILVGVQLIIYWIILRVLDELSQRENLTHKDLSLEVTQKASVRLA